MDDPTHEVGECRLHHQVLWASVDRRGDLGTIAFLLVSDLADLSSRTPIPELGTPEPVFRNAASVYETDAAFRKVAPGFAYVIQGRAGPGRGSFDVVLSFQGGSRFSKPAARLAQLLLRPEAPAPLRPLIGTSGTFPGHRSMVVRPS